MIITHLQLKNFRCFSQKTLNFSAPITLIKGKNGSGKTSILEALYYLCYLRSFRAYNAQDLIALGSHEFFIRALVQEDTDPGKHHDLRVGFAENKKLVKYDDRVISSFKELMDSYRVVALFEDDLALIKEGPDVRRSFIDQALLLLEPEKLADFRAFKHILDNRNALLKKYQGRILSDKDSYRVWTEQLWTSSLKLMRARHTLLDLLKESVNALFDTYFSQEITITIDYIAKGNNYMQDFSAFEQGLEALLAQELRFGRSLFGAHLDDFSIQYAGKHTRFFASRGQQKLVVLLLKVALLNQLTQRRGKTLFVLDDFMTDFDEHRTATLISLLSGITTQLIMTSPANHGFLEDLLQKAGADMYDLCD